MNQDFVFPRSPGLARRLIRVAATCERMEIDQSVIDLASQGFWSDDEFASVKVRDDFVKTAVQRLTDTNLRAVLVCDMLDLGRRAAFAACMLTGERKLTIVSEAHKRWSTMCAEHSLSATTNPREQADVLIVPDQLSAMSDETLTTERRQGVFIQERVDRHVPSRTHEVDCLSREFRKTVHIADASTTLNGGGWGPGCDTYISGIVETLFPSAPAYMAHGNTARIVYNKDLAQRGFTLSRSNVLDMFNVIVELLPEAKKPHDWFR